MTAGERRQQRAQILVELEEAETELSALQTKAARVADGLSAIASKLKRNAILEPEPEDFQPDFELKNRLSPESQSHFITYAAGIGLIEELKVARQKVFNLRRQKDMTR